MSEDRTTVPVIIVIGDSHIALPMEFNVFAESVEPANKLATAFETYDLPTFLRAVADDVEASNATWQKGLNHE